MQSHHTMLTQAQREERVKGVYHRMYQALEAHRKGHISYQEMKRLWHQEKDLVLAWHQGQQQGTSQQVTTSDKS